MKDSTLDQDKEILEGSEPSMEEGTAPQEEPEKASAEQPKKKKRIEKPKELEEKRQRELEEAAAMEEDELSDIPQGGRMSLMGHLGELRKRLFVCVICFLVAVMVIMFRAEWFVNLLLERGDHFAFVFIKPTELFMAYVKVALLGGVIVCIPVIISQIWLFVRPGLKKREQFGFFGVMLVGLVLFALGVYFAFEIVLPILLDFFARLETANTVSAMVSVEEYLNYVISTMTMFGIIFETPVVLVTLTAVGLVNPKFLQRNFKFIILIVLIVAAIITPPDVTSQILVAVPLLVLFYGSIILCNIIFRRKLAKKAAEEAELENY